MKTRVPVYLIVATIASCSVYAQAPKLNYYSQLGFSVGYAYGKVKGGPSLGVVQGSVVGNYIFFEGGAAKFAFFNEESPTRKITGLEALTMDLGLGYTSKNFFIGVSPFSIHWTPSGCYGMAMLFKYRLMYKYVFEAKIVPLVYGKPENYGLLNNNFYAGIHYWLTKKFSLGLRYNRYDFYGNWGILASWNLME